ncbi:DUF4347 domain-containing protein [Arcobacter aquimarinus]|uniref:DUF4347 domain-containing protein n=1 Tax=Arcobacter aquimarinus TaxID=1315211 RepID=UPI003BB0C5DD
MKRKNLKKPMISALEQRILFDGAAVATAVDVLDESSFSSNNTETTTTSNDVTQNNAENSVHEAQAVQGFERDRREVAFIDVTVSDYQTLVDGVGEGVEVYLVSSLDDINSILKSETNIDAIHILSHGNVGEISVGNDVLNQNTLNNFDAVLQTMKNSLSENGDILLYGCNVANDGTGQEFINTLASITEADVAASNDVTGNSNVNGDWDLEIKTGSIETSTIVVENYSSRLADVTYTENDSATLVANNVTISSGTNFSGGYVEFSLSESTSTETLSLVKEITASTTNGQISIVGNGVYIGNGTVAILVGSIDNTYNGENGQKLRINFSNTFANGNFSDTTATQTGTVVDISGWTIYLQQLMLGQNGVAGTSTIDGWATPIDSTPTPSNPNNPSQVSRGDDYTPSGPVYSYAFEDGALRLYSSGMTTAAGGDIVHGPYVVSDSTVTLSSGDSVSFDWKAKGGDDAYDIYAYLLNVDTGATVELLNQTGIGTSETAWATKNTNINTAGTYKFVFVSGTFDETFGQAAGASLYIDNIVVTQAVMPPAISGSVLQYITRNLTYHNSSETLNTVGETKNISINGITSGGTTDVSLSRSIEIIGVNDLPYISGKETVTVNEDTSITISGLTVGDNDSGSSNLTVTIDANYGTLSLGNSTGVTTSWDAINKTFQITGTVTNLNNALATLRYQGDSNWSGQDPLTITINDGQGSGEQPYKINQTGKFYNPNNGHYYEFVSASGITWDQAKIDAENRTLYGLNGYLVTITSDSENALITSMAGGNGWIGASDAENEGVWKWVTGPEAGQLLSNYFTNWASGEPNDSGIDGEDVAHFYYTGVNAGKWNDFNTNNTSSISGYIVEYGGLAGDNLQQAFLTVTVLPVNDAPTINNSTNTINYVENGSGIVLSPTITINDVDNTTLASATVSIGGFVSGDRLNFTNDASTMGNITASYNSTTGVLTLTSAGQTATLSQWENALKSVSYDSTSEALSLSEQTRIVSWTVNDGVLNSVVSTSTIKVLGVNDAPTLEILDLKNNFTESLDSNNQNLFKSGTINFSDLDNNVNITKINGSIVYSGGVLDNTIATALINGFTINTNNNVQSGGGTWSYNVSNIDLNFLAKGETITFSYTIIATDTQNATDTKIVTFKIIGTNDAPTFGSQDPANANPISSTPKQIFDNAGFENGLTGWTTNGNASVVDKDIVTFSASSSMQMTPEVKAILGNSNQMTWVVDSHGTGMVKLEANGASNEFNTNFQSDLNVSSDTVKYIKDTFYATSNKAPTNMAYISKTFYAEAGTTYSIAWNYISGDYVPWNDGSVLTFANNTNPSSTAVLDGVKAEVILLGATNPGTGNYTTSSYGSTGWQTTTIQVLESGSYTLGLSVFNLGDTALNPYLFVDNLVGTTTLNNQVFAPLQQDTNAPIPAGESFIIETGLTETNSGLSSSGTMSIEDKDLKDSVTVSVKSVSVDLRDSNNNLISNSLSQTTNEQLLSMLSLDSTLIIESGSTKGSFEWYFNSGNEAFNYLKAGEVLKLTYTFQADDGNGGLTEQTIDVIITGTNDTVVVNPLIPIEIVNTSNSSDSFSKVTGTIDTTDLDNDNLTYNILNSSNNPIQELVGVYGVLKLNSTTGQYEYIPNNTKINALTSSATENFKIKVSDSSTSSIQNLTVKIDYVNAMPLIGGDKSEVTFVENSKPIIIDSNITIVDPEYADFGAGYLRVDYLQGKEGSDNLTILEVGGITLDRGNVLYSGIKIGTIDTLQNGENGKSLKINLNDKAYSHQVQALARAIAFVNSTDDLSNTSRVIEFRVNDGGDSDNSMRFSSKESIVNIQTINDLPQINFNNSSYVVEKIININEDGTLVLDKISFADLDGEVLTVVLETTNYGTLTINNTIANGLISSQIVGNGTNSVTLTGTIEEINKTLASVNGIVYTAGIGNDFVTPGADFIKVTAIDELSGTSVSSKMVVVLPAIPNADSKNIVNKEDNPASVDLESLILDINDNNGFFTFGVGSADITDINGNITTAGNISSFDVTDIIYDENSNAIGYQLTSGKLILADSSSSLESNFTSKDGQFIFIPNENWYGNETFVYQYTSGDGDTSLIAQINVFVLPVNDKPVISVTTSDITIDEDTPYTFDNSNFIVISDIDNIPTQELELQIEVIEGKINLIDLSNVTILEGENASSKIVLRGTLDNLQETIKNLIYTPKNNYFGKDYLTIILDDLGASGEGGNKISNQTINFTINSVNDIPQIEVVDVTGSIIDGSKLNDKGSIKFTDADITDRPTAVENTKSIIGKAQDGTNLSLTQKQISDIENAFSIINLPTNVNNGTITWDYTISQDKINFLGAGETVTAVFSITVTDDDGVELTQDVTVTIIGSNDIPTVSFENIDFEIPFGEVYNKDISSLFSDKDLTNKFKFEATNLPLGLTIDSNTGIISGRVAQSGNFVIVITGIDSSGASVTRTYNMLVVAPARITDSAKPSSPFISTTNGDTNTNNSTDGLNNFTDSASNLGVLNFNSNDGLSVDTGIGFLDTSNNSSTNGGELNSSNIQNGEIDSSNNNSTNTSNTNDSRGVLQANVDLNVLTNGQIVFNEANQDSFSIVGITIEDIKIENNSIEIKVVDTNLSQNFIVTQIDGTALPAGLFFDPRTGNISGTIPEDLEKLEISIKAINQDGTTRVLNLKLDLKELKKAQKNQVDADEKYMGLKEQIALENQKLDDYGSYLTRLFA